MGRVCKLLRRAPTHENDLKIKLKINKHEKKGTFSLEMWNLESDIWALN